MNKVGATYWTNKPVKTGASVRNRAAAKGRAGASFSRWIGLAVVVGTMSVLCLAMNIRAFVEMNQETLEHKRLNTEVEQLSSLNVVLQEELKNLKDDPRMIEKEARKIGMSRPNEKILVPTN